MQMQTKLTRRSMLACMSATLGAAPLLLYQTSAAHGETTGKFVGNLSFKPVPTRGGEYQFELLQNYGYLDAAGRMWQAKARSPTDGASIPSVFWPIVGHPYEGLYLDAAVIHDFYCMRDNRYRKWEDVHHVFHEAMLAKGVGPTKAKLMFFAVWRFGPRWDISELKPCTPDPSRGDFCASVAPSGYAVKNRDVLAFDEAAERGILEKVEARIQADKPTLEQLIGYEADLPPLKREDQMTKFEQPAKMWYFEHPYRIPLVEPKE